MYERPRQKPSYVKFDRGKRETPPPVRLSAPPQRDRKSAWLAAIGVASLLGLVALGALALRDRPDPHYVRATKMVEAYELGKPEPARNYSNDVYRDALAELAQVNSASVSAQPAREMAEDIERRIAAFHARIERRRDDQRAVLDRYREREEINIQRTQHEVAHPQTVYPDCDEGEGAGHTH